MALPSRQLSQLDDLRDLISTDRFPAAVSLIESVRADALVSDVGLVSIADHWLRHADVLRGERGGREAQALMKEKFLGRTGSDDPELDYVGFIEQAKAGR